MMYSGIFLLSLQIVVDASTKYCARFDQANSAASGYFGIEIFNNTAFYSFALDLSKLTTPSQCDLDLGLNYYITTSWSPSSNKFSSNTCDITTVGGHYDPNLSCSPDSVNAVSTPDICASINRTEGLFRYTCNQKVMNHKNYGFCEVGDLSGKFGMTYPTYGGSAKFLQDDLLVDFHPPYDAYYGTKKVGYVNPWISITFGCLGGGNLVCAKILPYTRSMNTTCTFPSIYSPTSAPTGITPYWQNVVQNDKNAAICLIVISVGVVIAIYIYLAFQFRDQKIKDDAEKVAREKEEEKAKLEEAKVVPAAAVKH